MQRFFSHSFIKTICFVLCVACLCFAGNRFLSQKYVTATQQAYRTEEKPIKDRFPQFPDFSACYWKADTLGRNSLGPTNYWMCGFLLIEEKEASMLENEYQWEKSVVDFPKGIEPGVTKNNFSWYKSKDYNSTILQQNFVGDIYLDAENGIIYFDVENS